jgi:hypothetical protein
MKNAPQIKYLTHAQVKKQSVMPSMSLQLQDIKNGNAYRLKVYLVKYKSNKDE